MLQKGKFDRKSQLELSLEEHLSIIEHCIWQTFPKALKGASQGMQVIKQNTHRLCKPKSSCSFWQENYKDRGPTCGGGNLPQVCLIGNFWDPKLSKPLRPHQKQANMWSLYSKTSRSHLSHEHSQKALICFLSLCPKSLLFCLKSMRQKHFLLLDSIESLPQMRHDPVKLGLLLKSESNYLHSLLQGDSQ